MKKFISLALISAMLLLSASACSSASKTSSEPSGESSSVSSDTERTQAPADGTSHAPSEKEETSKDASVSSPEDAQESSESSPEESSENSENNGGMVDASWFDDAVFVGDSITVGLYNYAENGALGDAEFLAKQCMGYFSVMVDLDSDAGIHPEYKGQLVMVEDVLQEIGKSKVFIMLGMNDIAFCGAEQTVQGMLDFTDTILEKNPDVTIYIQSVTPILAEKVREDYLNNENIAEYNRLAKAACEERGYHFLDVASVMDDGSGGLRPEYCSDSQDVGFHFNTDGITAWVDYLKSNVQ